MVAMTLRRFTALLTREGDWHVARCAELDVVSQGKSIDEALANLREAVELYLESFGDEDIPGGVLAPGHARGRVPSGVDERVS